MPGSLDYGEFDERWYPFARENLSASPIPDDVLASPRYASSRRFIEHVRAAGLPDASGVRMPIDRPTDRDLITTQILDSPMGPLQGGPANVASLDWDNPKGPVTIIFAGIPLPFEANVMETIGIFIPDGHGQFTYGASRDEARLTFPPSAHGAAMEEARRRVAALGRSAGAVTAIDMTADDPTTLHPLGGAVIDKVTDPFGRVLGQRGLYVNDGALIPGSTACANPSLTIAALAERNMDQIVRHDVDSIF